MDKNRDSGNLVWNDVTRVVSAAASAAVSVAASAAATHPSIVLSSKDNGSNSQLQKLQRHVSRVLKGLSPPQQQANSRAYNPEVLTTQKRQWARFQNHKSVKEPSRIFESLVILGLHPDSDVQALQKQFSNKNPDCIKRSRTALNDLEQLQAGVNLEPQVLFAYPPEKELPLNYQDLLSFCFPGGLKIHAVERTPSMSELNEILIGQEHLKQSDLSFVFRLQAADSSTLYGCCVLIEEIVQKPSGLISILSEEKPVNPPISISSHHIITAPRCYCILSRLPFFELHFGVLKRESYVGSNGC